MWFVKKLLPLPLGPRMNLFRFVITPRFIGSSEMSRCTGTPVRRSTILIPKGEGLLR